MKNGFCFACSLFALFFSTIVAPAQVTIDVAKITCRQLLTGRMLSTDKMTLWFGVYFNGKRGATIIDVSAVKTNAKKVQDYCGLHQDETVMNAVETLFGIK